MVQMCLRIKLSSWNIDAVFLFICCLFFSLTVVEKSVLDVYGRPDYTFELGCLMKHLPLRYITTRIQTNVLKKQVVIKKLLVSSKIRPI